MSYDYYLKVIFVGDASIGKTSILNRFAENRHNPQEEPTLGVDFKTKSFELVVPPYGKKKVRLSLWDTAGQERFRTLTTAYYRGAHGVVLCYDITKASTFRSLQDWMKVISNNTDESAVVMVVGNKTDLANHRAISKEQGLEFASHHKVLYLETSAVLGDHIDTLFEELIRQIICEINENGQPAVSGHSHQTHTINLEEPTSTSTSSSASKRCKC